MVAAIDASAWIYKGAYACAIDLAHGNKTYRYLNYTLKMVRLLRRWNIKPILVFDGLTLPLKKGTETGRSDEKRKNRELALKLESEGKEEEAANLFARSIFVNTEMMTTIMDILY